MKKYKPILKNLYKISLINDYNRILKGNQIIKDIIKIIANKIVIISTNRIESINKFDKVFLLDKGKIISTSTFIDLVNKTMK